MVGCYLQGGLGNNMFQIAAAHSLALDNNDISVFNGDNVGQVHKNINEYKDNIFKNVNIQKNPKYKKTYNEPFFNFNGIKYMDGLLLVGYFQSEKYFKHNKKEIIKLFYPNEKHIQHIKEKYEKILDKKTCSIHVRRGDYLNLPNHHPVCTLEYYNRAIELMTVDKFVVFSDDIHWCRENFIGDKFIFIEGNSDYIDLWLMSFCDNNIIANSSFSWWGAWLNKNENKKIISPETWFGEDKKLETKDIVPTKWKKI